MCSTTKIKYVYEYKYKYQGIWNQPQKPIYFHSEPSKKTWTLKYLIASMRKLNKNQASYITVRPEYIKGVLE